MLFIGIAITGGCQSCARGGGCQSCTGGAGVGCGGRTLPEPNPNPKPGPEPKVETDFCEMQGTFAYDSSKLSDAEKSRIINYLMGQNARGESEGKKVGLYIYAFASIEGEGSYNLLLSDKRADAIEALVDQTIETLGPRMGDIYIDINEVEGYGKTEVWGTVDRTKLREAINKGGKTFKDFVTSDAALKANRRYILSTREIPKPKQGWKFTQQLAGAGGGPYGSLCGIGDRNKTKCGNGKIDPGERCDPRAEKDTCPEGQVCKPDCTCGQMKDKEKCICPIGFLYRWMGFEPCDWHWLLRIPLCWWPLLLFLLIFRKRKSKTVRIWNIIIAKKEYKKKMGEIITEKDKLIRQVPNSLHPGGQQGQGAQQGLDTDAQAANLAQALKDYLSSATTAPADVDVTRVMQKPGENVEHDKCKSLQSIISDRNFKNNKKGLKILFDYLSAFNLSKTTASLICKVFKKYRETYGRSVSNFDTKLKNITKHYVSKRAEMHLLHEFFVLQEKILDLTKRFQARDLDDTYAILESLTKEEKRTWRTLWLANKKESFNKYSYEKTVKQGQATTTNKTPKGQVPPVLGLAKDVNGLCEQMRHIASRLLKDYAGRVKGNQKDSRIHQLKDAQVTEIIELWNKERSVWDELKKKIDEQEKKLREVLEVKMITPKGIEKDKQGSTFHEDDDATFKAEIRGGIPPYEIEWVWGTRVGGDQYSVLAKQRIDASQVQQQHGRNIVSVALSRKINEQLDPNLNTHLSPKTSMDPLAGFYHIRHSSEKFHVGLQVRDNINAPKEERQVNNSVVPIIVKRTKRVQGPPEVWVTFDNNKRPHHPDKNKPWKYGINEEKEFVKGQWISPETARGVPYWFSGIFNPPGSPKSVGTLQFKVKNQGGSAKLKWRLSIHKMKGDEADVDNDPEESLGQWLAYRILKYQGHPEKWTYFRCGAGADGYISKNLEGAEEGGKLSSWHISVYFRVPTKQVKGKYYILLRVTDENGKELDYNYIPFEVKGPKGAPTAKKHPGRYLQFYGKSSLDKIYTHIQGYADEAWAEALKPEGLSSRIRNDVDTHCGTELNQGKPVPFEKLKEVEAHLKGKGSPDEEPLLKLVKVSQLLNQDWLNNFRWAFDYVKGLDTLTKVPADFHERDAKVKTIFEQFVRYLDILLKLNKEIGKLHYAPRDDLLEPKMEKLAEKKLKEPVEDLLKDMPDAKKEEYPPVVEVQSSSTNQETSRTAQAGQTTPTKTRPTDGEAVISDRDINTLNDYQDEIRKDQKEKKKEMRDAGVDPPVAPPEESFVWLEGKGEKDYQKAVLISAPHAVMHYRPNDRKKVSDMYTGAIAKLIHEKTGIPCIYQRYYSYDSNSYHTQHYPGGNRNKLHPYKKRIAEYLDKHPEVSLVVDIHGKETDGVDLGFGRGTTKDATIVKSKWEKPLKKILSDKGISGVITKNVFPATGQETVTEFVNKLKRQQSSPYTDYSNVNPDIESLQIEIGSDYRGKDFDNGIIPRNKRISMYKKGQKKIINALIDILKSIKPD